MTWVLFSDRAPWCGASSSAVRAATTAGNPSGRADGRGRSARRSAQLTPDAIEPFTTPSAPPGRELSGHLDADPWTRGAPPTSTAPPAP
ncbi:hypothetical protein ACFPN0_25940 [Kitasatospora cinereorecta]